MRPHPHSPPTPPLALVQLLLDFRHLALDPRNGSSQALGLRRLVCPRPPLCLCPPQRLLQLGIILFKVLLKALAVLLQGCLRGLQVAGGVGSVGVFESAVVAVSKKEGRAGGSECELHGSLAGKAVGNPPTNHPPSPPNTCTAICSAGSHRQGLLPLLRPLLQLCDFAVLGVQPHLGQEDLQAAQAAAMWQAGRPAAGRQVEAPAHTHPPAAPTSHPRARSSRTCRFLATSSRMFSPLCRT